ncbi:MAG: hypothetical protein AAGL99_05515 [Pseudomonadota bacterium]
MNIRIIPVLILLLVSLGACATDRSDMRQVDPASEIAVSTESSEYLEIARRSSDMCNHSAEFGACGCYMNGFLTTCSVALDCLEAGFCVREKNATGIAVNTKSAKHSPLLNGVSTMCAIHAEYWRCECSLDGQTANCDMVSRCLDSGFCIAVDSQGG